MAGNEVSQFRLRAGVQEEAEDKNERKPRPKNNLS